MISEAILIGISGQNTFTDNRQGEKMVNKMVEFLSLCPILGRKEINVNYLDHSDMSVMIKPVGERQVVRRYADGGTLKAAVFKVVIRRSFGPEIRENKRIAEEFNLVEKWIEEQNLKGNLPEVTNAQKAVSIGVAKCFEVSETDRNSSRYEAEIELVYLS